MSMDKSSTDEDHSMGKASTDDQPSMCKASTNKYNIKFKSVNWGKMLGLM